jgi:hypothetical protein
MNNPGTVLWKVVALVGGATLGAFLAHWVDGFLARHAQKQSDYDKARYAQGLGPIDPPPSGQNDPPTERREEW